MPSRLLFVPFNLMATQWPVLWRDVVHQRTLGAEVHQKRIHLAVVVVVGKARAARHGARTQHRSGVARDIRKFVVAQAAKESVLLRDEMNQSAVKDEDVELAVVVEVVDACSPADVLRVGLRHAVGRADIVEAEFVCISQHAVVVAVGDPEVERAAAFEIGEDRAHGGSGFAVLSEGSAGVVADFFKGTVVLVMEEEVFSAIVGYIDVVPSVAIEVCRGDAHGAANKGADAGLF